MYLPVETSEFGEARDTILLKKGLTLADIDRTSRNRAVRRLKQSLDEEAGQRKVPNMVTYKSTCSNFLKFNVPFIKNAHKAVHAAAVAHWPLQTLY
jgi:hypothetical protein